MAVAGPWTGKIHMPFRPQFTGPRLNPLFCCSPPNSALQWSSFTLTTAIGGVWNSGNREVVVVKKGGLGRVLVRASQEASTSTLLVQEVEFTWKAEGSEVLLTGDFLKWETKLVLEKKPDGVFSLKQNLPLGRYLYKFVVDGTWKHSSDSPMVPDGTGGFNNEAIVTVGGDPTTTLEETKDLPDVAPKIVSAEPTAGVEKPAATTGTEPAKEIENAAAATTTQPAKGIDNAAATTTTQPAKEIDNTAATTTTQPTKKIDNVATGKGEQGNSPKPVPKAAVAKKVAKTLEATMLEDVIPLLTSTLGKEEGISALDITFEDNQLKTSFVKGDIPYCFWAFFPDGTLEGSRGSSLTSHGSSPSTIEPFLIDEKKITPELIVFWVKKRLFAQKFLSLN